MKLWHSVLQDVADAKTAYGIENWKSIFYGREVLCGFLNTKITVLSLQQSLGCKLIVTWLIFNVLLQAFLGLLTLFQASAFGRSWGK